MCSAFHRCSPRPSCVSWQVRIPAKCKTCGRAKGTVPKWEQGNDLVTATKRGNLPVVMQMTEAGADLEVTGGWWEERGQA